MQCTLRSRGFSCFAQIDVEGYIDVPVNMLRIRALIERDVGGMMWVEYVIAIKHP